MIASPTAGRAAEGLPKPSALPLFAKITASIAYVLLFAGALVTSTGSSLAVPDWPLSFHRAFPPMLGGVLFEHGHRMIAGTVASMTFALAAWLGRVEPRPWVRKLGYAAAFGIVCQAVLGGVTVLLRLPPAVSIAHACLGQAVFCLLLSIAEAQRSEYLLPAKGPALPGLWRTGAAAVAAVYVQLVFGALFRHGLGFALPLHMGWAVVAATAALALAAKGILGSSAELAGPSALLGAAVPAQLLLGFASLRVKTAADFTARIQWSAAVSAAHLAVGALILGACVVWTQRAYRSRR